MSDSLKGSPKQLKKLLSIIFVDVSPLPSTAPESSPSSSVNFMLVNSPSWLRPICERTPGVAPTGSLRPRGVPALLRMLGLRNRSDLSELRSIVAVKAAGDWARLKSEWLGCLRANLQAQANNRLMRPKLGDVAG